MKRAIASAALLAGLAVTGSALGYQTFPPWGMIYLQDLSGTPMCVHGGARGLSPFAEPCDMSNYFQFVRWDPDGQIHVWDNSCVGDVVASLQPLVDVDCCAPGSCSYTAVNWFQDGSGQVYTEVSSNGPVCMACDTSGGGADCIAAPCIGAATESFNMRALKGQNPYPYVGYTMRPYFPARPDLVLDVHDNGRDNGTPVDITEYNGTPAQFWWYEPATKEIHLTDSDNKCLDKPLGQNADGTKLQIWDCWGGPNQQWERAAPNQWINVESGTCLDAPNNQVHVDAWVYGCWGGLNQQWNGPHS